MTVEFWNYSKKKNSTKQPTAGSGTSYTNFNLKDSCSTLNPIITIAVASMPVATVAPINTFTYCYINKFNRYYFIEDWVYINNIWEAHLSIDVLASHKVQIGAMSEYVVRAASTKDGSIIDVAYPATSNITLTNTTLNLNLDTTGFYVLGVINNSGTISEGAISYYVMSAQQLANLKSYLMSNTFLNDNNLYTNPDISPDLLKALFNPFQYIVSCKFYPLPFPTYAPDVTGVNFGWWMLPYGAKRLPEGGYIIGRTSADFTVPSHPQSARGTYLNHAPYTDIVIYHPLLGTIPLDMAKIDAGDKINIYIEGETVTGQGYVTIRTNRGGSNYVLYQSSFQLAIDVPLAQMNIDTINVARTAINTAGNVLSSAMSLNVGGVITAAGNGVLDALQAQAPVLQSSGTAGNRANFSALAIVTVVQRTVANDDPTNRGYPLCQTKTLNTLSGFIKVVDAHVDIPCLAAERDMIVNFMESGFYYE